MKQADLGLNLSIKRTRKREFLDEMNSVAPWAALVMPHAPAGRQGRPLFRVLRRNGTTHRGRHDGLNKADRPDVDRSLTAIGITWLVFFPDFKPWREPRTKPPKAIEIPRQPRIEATLEMPGPVIYVVAVPGDIYEVQRCVVAVTHTGAVSTSCGSPQTDLRAPE